MNLKADTKDPNSIHIEAVYALPDEQILVSLELNQGATVAEALELLKQHPSLLEVPWKELTPGIYGEVVTNTGRVLVTGDRIELYRALKLSPMQARRARAEAESGASG